LQPVVQDSGGRFDARRPGAAHDRSWGVPRGPNPGHYEPGALPSATAIARIAQSGVEAAGERFRRGAAENRAGRQAAGILKPFRVGDLASCSLSQERPPRVPRIRSGASFDRPSPSGATAMNDARVPSPLEGEGGCRRQPDEGDTAALAKQSRGRLQMTRSKDGPSPGPASAGHPLPQRGEGPRFD
jgi:hypothetical protein